MSLKSLVSSLYVWALMLENKGIMFVRAEASCPYFTCPDQGSSLHDDNGNLVCSDDSCLQDCSGGCVLGCPFDAYQGTQSSADAGCTQSQTCQCHNNGCNQCMTNYWKLNFDFPCQACNLEGCKQCADFHGCQECEMDYTRTPAVGCGIESDQYDITRPVYYCLPDGEDPCDEFGTNSETPFIPDETFLNDLVATADSFVGDNPSILPFLNKFDENAVYCIHNTCAYGKDAIANDILTGFLGIFDDINQLITSSIVDEGLFYIEYAFCFSKGSCKGWVKGVMFGKVNNDGLITEMQEMYHPTEDAALNEIERVAMCIEDNMVY